MAPPKEQPGVIVHRSAANRLPLTALGPVSITDDPQVIFYISIASTSAGGEDSASGMVWHRWRAVAGEHRGRW